MKLTGAKETILVLCSDPILLSVLQETLTDHGYVVLPAGDLGAAVERLKDCKPDLLIVRPHIDSIVGHDAARYLRTQHHALRVLILGGLLDDDRLRSRETLRGFEVFPKPFTDAELLEKVRQVLDTSPAALSGQVL